MAFTENHGDDGSSPFADEGSAAHAMAALALNNGVPCSEYIGTPLFTGANGKVWNGTEEMADDVQVYVDEVNRRRMERPNWIEQQVDISHVLRVPGQFGTADCIIAHPEDRLLEVIDLKFGKGEKVYAKRNYQLMLYALGALRLPELDLIYEFDTIRVCIAQVRVASEFEEWECPIAELLEFQEWAWKRCEQAAHYYTLSLDSIKQGRGEDWTVAVARQNRAIVPGTKQCRWCKVKATCPELTAFVQEQVAADFEVIAAEEPVVPRRADMLAKAMCAVPLIEIWCKGVREQAASAIDGGAVIVGTDGLPMKFVEGKGGKRKWNDELAAEALLVGQLGPAAYQPHKIITAPVAAKKFDKQRTAATWELFKPLITKGSGKRVLTLGSDPRPQYQGAASADEFDDESE